MACWAACAREPVEPPDATDREPTSPPATTITTQPTDDRPEPTAGTADTAPPGETAAPPAPPRWFAFVGSGEGHIHVFAVDPRSGALATAGAYPAGESPSFLALSADLRFLYAVDEAADELAAFSLDPATGALAELDRTPSGGDGPTHVAVPPTGAVALAANYGSGDVTMVRIEADGTFGPTLTTLATGDHAHQVALDPTSRFAFVPNLGDDTVSQLLLDPAGGTLAPNAVPALATRAGSGPRHLAFAPAAPFAWLLHELDDTVTALAFDAAKGRLAPIETVSTLPAGVDGGDNACAEIAVSPDGRFVYASNRGHDSIVAWAVGADGRLSLIGHTSTGGSWPRHFSLSPDGALLLVANQRSDEVVTFRVDRSTGSLAELATTAVPSPAFVGVVDLRVTPRG